MEELNSLTKPTLTDVDIQKPPLTAVGLSPM